MRIKINGEIMYGDYTETQINIINEEMNKPKEKRLYMMGIEFKLVDEVEVLR